MQVRCLVCEKNVECELVETYKNYSILKCPNCELQFADPIDYTELNYINAYEGKNVELYDYSYAIDVSLARIEQMSYALYSSADRLMIKWLKNNLPSSNVLDLGCGGGIFLEILKREGFSPMGMDIALKPIRILKQRGFKVAIGSIDDYPSYWQEPDVIVLRHVLEHLPNPLEFLKKISHRFYAPIMVDVPSPYRWNIRKGKRYLDGYPPHHFTKWNEKSLSIALQKAGYRPQICFPPVIPEEIPVIVEKIVEFLKRRGKKPKVDKNNTRRINSQSDRYYKVYYKVIRSLRLVKLIYLTKRYSYPRIYSTYFNLKGYSSKSFVAIGLPSSHSKL